MFLLRATREEDVTIVASAVDAFMDGMETSTSNSDVGGVGEEETLSLRLIASNCLSRAGYLDLTFTE